MRQRGRRDAHAVPCSMPSGPLPHEQVCIFSSEQELSFRIPVWLFLSQKHVTACPEAKLGATPDGSEHTLGSVFRAP